MLFYEQGYLLTKATIIHKMTTKPWCLSFIMILCDAGVMGNTILLIPTHLNAIENSSATITCSRTDGMPLLETIWVNSQIESDANLYKLNGQCITTRFLNNNDLFRGVCNSNGTYSVVIKKIDRSQHGAAWICKATFQVLGSNTVVIQVSVPATRVILRQPNEDYLIENKTEQIICSTSACRPHPRVQWYLRNSSGLLVKNLTQFSKNQFVVGEHGLVSSKSVLDFRQNRTANYLSLFCEVLTRSEKADIKSREIIVNVTYPPDNSPFIKTNGSNHIMQIIESDTGTFVCSVTGGNPLASLIWSCFDRNDATLERQGSTVTSTITWKAMRNFRICSCTSIHIITNWRRTTNVTVDVQYPPTKPVLKIRQINVTSDVLVIENNTLQVVCNSESNPLPNYTWTGPEFIKKDDTLELNSVTMSNKGKYECKATNRMTRSNNSYVDGSHLSSVNLIILYPPSHPKFRFQNASGQHIQSKTFYVVKADTFSIYCDVDGNPAPHVTWDKIKNNPVLRISNIKLDTNGTCEATNVMKETANQAEITSKSEASLSIIVFYPPRLPTIHVSNNKGDIIQVQKENVAIVESETINVTCFSESKPMPTYIWTKESSSKTLPANVLEFENINRNERGTYTCNVENIMKRSIGKTEIGKNSSTIILNILYPAIVNDMYDISVVEGSLFETLCPVVYGNPSNSTVTWSRQNNVNETKWNNRLLFIKSISRTDDADYMCSVITEMFPTIGSSSKIERRKSFHLNVFFPSEIQTFTLSTEKSGGHFAVNKNGSLSFECIAEAKPTSDLKIQSPRGDYIIEVSQSNIARHTLRNASFKDAGVYICTGRNNYTRDSPSQSKLILIVKSQPRPSSGDTSAMKVATVLGDDVILLFTAWSYLDEQNKTMFSWFKENVSVSDNDNKYMILSNDLHTNITIRNTTQQDLGLYKVNVKNSVGMYTQYYELKATDKPKRPRDFRVLNDSITDTSVTLAWRPGFNGGLEQTFVILYKLMQELVWMNKSIKDNGDINMNYTLNDLSSLQEYEIEMFARNIEGNSFHTNRFHFKTKASLKKTEETTHSSNTRTFVGVGVGASVVTLAIVAGSLFGYKTFKNIRSSHRESPKQGVIAGSHVSSTYTDLDASRREINNYDDFNVTYEHLNASTREPNTYMELKNTNVPNADTSDYVNIRI